MHGISWEQFKAIEAQLENNRGVRLAYLAGVMEIMSPIGDYHEYIKSTLGVLLEAYARVKGISNGCIGSGGSGGIRYVVSFRFLLARHQEFNFLFPLC